MKRYAFVLHGGTYAHKNALWEKGFRWDRTHKAWVADMSVTNTLANDALRDWVRSLDGVSLTMELADKFPVLTSLRAFRQ